MMPIHLREYREPTHARVETLEMDGEQRIKVTWREPFVFGNTNPYSDGKLWASQKLRKNYDRMRVVDVDFNTQTERVVSLTYAYR